MLDDSCVEYINNAHRIAGLTVLPGFLTAGTRVALCKSMATLTLTTTCRDTQTSRTRWYESWREYSRASATRLQSIGTRLSSAIENASDRCSSSRPRINTPSSGLPTPLYTFRYTTHTAHDTNTIGGRYYVFPYPLSAREGQDFCSGTGQEDRNVITLENGVISWAFKGHSDECNNDLFHTYHLHKQLFPCPIARKVTRNVPRKGKFTLFFC